MSEAATVQATQTLAPEWVRHKVSYLSKDGKIIRLLDCYDNNDEHKAGHLDISPYRSGDFVLAWIEGGVLKGLKFPPGMEPSYKTPNAKETTAQAKKLATSEQPNENPKKTLVTQPTAKPVEPEKATQKTAPAVQKPKPPHIMTIGSGFVIIAGTPKGDQKFILVDNALKYIKSFKEGDMVNFSCMGNDKIKSMWKVDADGNRPQRDNTYQGNQKDPIAEAKRQLLMVRENVLNRAVELWINGNPGKVCIEADENTILKRAEFFEGWVLREIQ